MGEVSAEVIAAALGIGVPAVNSRAKRGGWVGRKDGRSHAWIYSRQSLPQDVQQALIDSRKAQRFAALAQQAASLELTTPMVSADAIAAAARQTAAPVTTAMLAGDGGKRRDAKAAIVNLYKLFLIHSGLADGTAGRLRFTDLYNTVRDRGDGEFEADSIHAGKRYFLAVPAWIRETRGHIAPSSLWNWQKTATADVNALAGRYVARKSMIDQAGQPKLGADGLNAAAIPVSLDLDKTGVYRARSGFVVSPEKVKDRLDKGIIIRAK